MNSVEFMALLLYKLANFTFVLYIRLTDQTFFINKLLTIF